MKNNNDEVTLVPPTILTPKDGEVLNGEDGVTVRFSQYEEYDPNEPNDAIDPHFSMPPGESDEEKYPCVNKDAHDLMIETGFKRLEHLRSIRVHINNLGYLAFALLVMIAVVYPLLPAENNVLNIIIQITWVVSMVATVYGSMPRTYLSVLSARDVHETNYSILSQQLLEALYDTAKQNVEVNTKRMKGLRIAYIALIATVFLIML